MTDCPDIDVLLERALPGVEHARTCAACAAVLSLLELREERSASRNDACIDAEVALGLEADGLLDAAGKARLGAHLEGCAECSEVAVRVEVTAGALTSDVSRALPEPRGPSAPVSWGLPLGVAAGVLAVAAALAVLWLGARTNEVLPVTAEAPQAPTASAGFGVESPPAPPPVLTAPPLLPVPPVPKVPVPDVVDPWAEPRTPAATGGTGYLTIMCVPGCDSVSAGGTVLGPSPIVRQPVPAGPLDVELRSGKVKRRLRLNIVANKTAAHRISMEAAPDPLVDPWR